MMIPNIEPGKEKEFRQQAGEFSMMMKDCTVIIAEKGNSYSNDTFSKLIAPKSNSSVNPNS